MEDITVKELKQKLDNNEKVLVIDVREPYEYDEFNINGMLIPLGELQGKVDDLEEYKNDEVVVHCRSGARSAAAKGYLVQQGFTNVRNLIGGMIEWQNTFNS